MHIFHKWTRWSEDHKAVEYIDRETGRVFFKWFQERCCEKCGERQLKRLLG